VASFLTRYIFSVSSYLIRLISFVSAESGTRSAEEAVVAVTEFHPGGHPRRIIGEIVQQLFLSIHKGPFHAILMTGLFNPPWGVHSTLSGLHQ
jgi:hypothetical protein